MHYDDDHIVEIRNTVLVQILLEHETEVHFDDDALIIRAENWFCY